MRLFSLGTFSLSSVCSSSTSFPPRALLLRFSQFSTSSSSNHSSYSSRRHDEESRNVRVSVWWDFENCNVPAGVNVFKVAHLITAAVRANGIKGPVQITAFGDILQLSRANQEALSSTGISLTHIPHGGKNSADRSLLVDLMYWVSQNPPPAHLFLISGDRDFASILHRLRMNNYNVLLASPESAPGVLCSAASIMWHWHALIRGENLVGKHFNQPPDGPYGSWYGHYKLPLEDPFPPNEQPSSSRVEEVSEATSDPKPRPIPKTVVKQIRHFLKLHPKGISITEFRSELGKNNISMDKDYYGYKKFSRFLLSMPHILKLQTNNDGQFIVHIVTPRAIEPFDSSEGTVDEASNRIGEQDPNGTRMFNNNGSSTDAPVLPRSELNGQDRPMKVPQQSSEFGKSIGDAMDGEPSIRPLSEPHVIEDSKQANKLEADSNTSPLIEQHSEAKMGFFKRIWRRFLDSNDHNSESGSHSVSEKFSSKQESSNGLVTTDASSDSLGEAKTDGQTAKPTSRDASSVHPVSYSPDHESTKLQKTAIVSNAYDDNSSSNPGLLGSVGKWFKFWKNDTENGKVSEQCREQNSGKHEFLSSNSFWQDIQSFMETPKGAEIISRSKTRLEMAQNLLEDGPAALKSLSKSDLLYFLELLISDKKWVEECPSHTNPFKLTLSTARKSSCTKPLQRSNGLTAIFLNTVSQPSSQGLPEHDSDEKTESNPLAGVSTTMTKSKVPGRTRSEMLSDCQKLVDEILSEHPEGYNMGAFRRLFLEKYGYHLDLQKLGYPKLASLLQIMPGVTIAATFIIPNSKAPKISNLETVLPSNLGNRVSYILENSDNESSDPPRKEDDFESTWEELGPACTSCNRNEEEWMLSREAVEATEKQSKLDYEPLPEDDLTESDGEGCPTTRRSEGQGKPQTNEEESSLLQILDSWYSSKEDASRKDKSQNTEEMIDCSANSLNLSSFTAKSEANVGTFSRKQRHQKSYSFVSDTEENKEKLIDGILGTLKKSSESRMHNCIGFESSHKKR